MRRWDVIANGAMEVRCTRLGEGELLPAGESVGNQRWMSCSRIERTINVLLQRNKHIHMWALLPFSHKNINFFFLQSHSLDSLFFFSTNFFPQIGFMLIWNPSANNKPQVQLIEMHERSMPFVTKTEPSPLDRSRSKYTHRMMGIITGNPFEWISFLKLLLFRKYKVEFNINEDGNKGKSHWKKCPFNCEMSS